MPDNKGRLFREIINLQGLLVGHAVTKMLEVQDVVLIDRVVVTGIGEFERQDSVVGEILPVDAGEGLGDDNAQPEVTGRDRGVLA
jgi:hypothetical protein